MLLFDKLEMVMENGNYWENAMALEAKKKTKKTFGHAVTITLKVETASVSGHITPHSH